MSKACEGTIEPRIHTSRFVDANENNSGSSRRDRPNGFCRSTLPSIMPSTSNAIFYPDVYSRRFEPRRSLSGIKVGLPPDPDHDRILETAAVNMSMPLGRQGETDFCSCLIEVNHFALRTSLRRVPLNRSLYPFSPGLQYILIGISLPGHPNTFTSS